VTAADRELIEEARHPAYSRVEIMGRLKAVETGASTSLERHLAAALEAALTRAEEAERQLDLARTAREQWLHICRPVRIRGSRSA
jgi:hypothetical protein